MSQTDLTFSDARGTATGFDEIAVRQAFGIDLYVGNDNAPMMAARAVIFIFKRRDGLKDAEAKEYAMGLSSREADDFFADEPEDADPDDPDSESGKDDSSTGTPPTD